MKTPSNALSGQHDVKSSSLFNDMSNGDNVFVISGVVDFFLEQDLDYKIQNNELDTNKPISVIINSIGGDVSSGTYIYETLRNRFPSVSTYAFGNVYSIATIIYLAAEKERRFSSAAAMFMIHNPWFSTMGDREKLLKDAERLGKFETALANIYSSRLSLPEDKIRDIMNSESVYSVKEAVELGMVGSILGAEDEAEAMGAFVSGTSPAIAANVRKTKENEMDNDVKRVDNSAAEVARLRGLAALLGHGYDDKVAEAMEEGGVDAGTLAIQLISSAKARQVSAPDAKASKPGVEAPAAAPQDGQPDSPKAAEKTATWVRPSIQPPQDSGPEKEVDEVKAAFDSNPSVRAAFSTLENFRLFVAKN